jgi:hypothetical protein
MSLDDEIKDLLDVDDAEKALEKATAAYRKKPTPAAKAAYRKANDALAAARLTARENRPMGVGGDAFQVEE